MCDQTEVAYLENDVVWVKIGSIWWPSVVVELEKTEEGKEILSSFKAKPLATVKFFEEDNYEFVKNLENIYHYNCRRKDEFIRKGLDKYRSGASHMAKFVDDIKRAEALVNGDVNIIYDPKFQPEVKQSYSDLFGSPNKKKKKDKLDLSLKTKQKFSSSTPNRPITHQRFINKLLKGESDHEVRLRIQSSYLDETSGFKLYSCPVCKLKANRVDVIVAHHRRIHSKRTVDWSESVGFKPVKRKPASAIRSRKPKVKKLADDKYETTSSTPNKSDITSPVSSSPKKKYTDELLADWSDEDDNKPAQETSSEKKDDSKTGSCFDFDDDEEGFIGMSNAQTYGRKIPRVIPVKDKTDLGVDLEIEELFKHQSVNETVEEELVESVKEKPSSKKKVKTVEEEAKPAPKRKLSDTKETKTEEKEATPVVESLASRRARRPGSKKSYLNEIIEPVITEEDKITTVEKVVSKPVSVKRKSTDKEHKTEREGGSSRRKQDLKTLTDLDDDPTYGEDVDKIDASVKVVEPAKKQGRRKSGAGAVAVSVTSPVVPQQPVEPDELASKIDDLLAETVPTALDETLSKDIPLTTHVTESSELVKDDSVLEQQTDDKPEEAKPKLLISDKGKRISISRGGRAITLLPVVKSGTSAATSGESCVVLPSNQKFSIKKVIRKEPPQGVQNIKFKTEGLTPSILAGSKLKAQTILHQKDGKYVILTPPVAKKTATTSATVSIATLTGSPTIKTTAKSSKVVIVTNQKGEQKIIKASSVGRDDEAGKSPIMKMISDGKGGMKKIALSPKKVILGGNKILMTSGGSSSSGNLLHVIENYKGTGKTVIFQEHPKTVQTQSAQARPKILMRRTEEGSKILIKKTMKPVQSEKIVRTVAAQLPVQQTIQVTAAPTVLASTTVTQPQVVAMPGPAAPDGSPTYVLVTVDEHGTVHPVDNSSIVDLYVTPAPGQPTQQPDILAEALANTNVLDGTDTLPLLPPPITPSVVQETSVTLQKPIMTPLEIPSSVAPDTSGLEPPPLPPTPTEEVLMDTEQIQDYDGQFQYQQVEQVIYTDEQVDNNQTYYQVQDVGNYTDDTAGHTYEQQLQEESYLIEDSQEAVVEEQQPADYHSMPLLGEEPDTSDDVPITDQDFVIHSSQTEQVVVTEQQSLPIITEDDLLTRKRFQEETEVTSTTDEYDKEQ